MVMYRACEEAKEGRWVRCRVEGDGRAEGAWTKWTWRVFRWLESLPITRVPLRQSRGVCELRGIGGVYWATVLPCDSLGPGLCDLGVK